MTGIPSTDNLNSSHFDDADKHERDKDGLAMSAKSPPQVPGKRFGCSAESARDTLSCNSLARWDVMASFENELSGELRATVRLDGSPALILYRPHRYASFSVRNVRNNADARLLDAIRQQLPQQEKISDTGRLLCIWLRWVRSKSRFTKTLRDFSGE